MKDSQLAKIRDNHRAKYIKADNERFSTGGSIRLTSR